MVATKSASPLEGLDALTSEFDTALALFGERRYAELDERLRALEVQAGAMLDSGALAELRDALDRRSISDGAVRASCDRIGRRLQLLSEVARQVIEVELGMTEMIEAPTEGAYGRDGQCGDAAGSGLQHEA